tara:strand:- start:151 stop:342 length:192 start_codon:yes stop_codon:yes gene_type:complete
MRLLIVLALLGAPIAHAGGVVLGPPPEPPTSTPSPSDPLPQETIDCIVAAVQAGLDPEVECDL